MKNISNDISCIPIEFSTLYGLSSNDHSFPLCTEQALQNFKKTFVAWSIAFQELFDTCSKACTTFQYTGEMNSQLRGFTNNSRHVFIGYWFNYEDEVEVFEEYLIYEITSVIGSIGGTLGLFIGFSFFDMSTKLINIFQNNFLNVNA